MASSVFFKFKSSKEPQRVTFDGTGISVFELKREIITICRLGDGTDFDLTIYNEDGSEEYDDDTHIIPRSTTVVARRLPAGKPGQGRAARYVSGRMPVNAKSTHRSEPVSSRPPASSVPVGGNDTGLGLAQTEEEKIAAVHRLADDQWQQQKQQMSSATPVFRPGGAKPKPANVPEGRPPPTYICHRCGEKDHWIQECPTNGDPNYDGGKHRFKRTTGIPRSFLKTVERPDVAQDDGLTDESKQPNGIMRDADGKYVIAVPDQASWEKYQSKAQASAAAASASENDSELIELAKRGLLCPIDSRLFVDPTKTPCCGATYCSECIENALANNDLVCPGCSTDSVLFDNLLPDDEMRAKIDAYEKEKKNARMVETKTADPAVVNAPSMEPANSPTAAKVSDPNQVSSPKTHTHTKSADPETSRKRPADHELPSDGKASAGSPRNKAARLNPATGTDASAGSALDRKFIDDMNSLAPSMYMNFNGGFPMMEMPPGMNMSMMMGAPPPMMNPMMMNGMGMPQWVPSGNGFPVMNANLGPNAIFNQQPNTTAVSNKEGTKSYVDGAPTGPRAQRNLHQQQITPQTRPYIRPPVNSQRQPPRQRNTRPADYKQL